jgi:acetylornithine deacetylase
VTTDLEAILPVLERLVAFDTTSPNSNLELVACIEELLAGAGIGFRRIPDPVLPKASLWVTIGPPDRPGYVLSSHTDTVPVTGQIWTSDPYRLRRDAGRLYARGAVDMKGFLAVCLALAPQMADAHLATPIHLAISYDEEVGCTGVKPMLEEIARLPVRPRGCFVGEPTGMGVVIGHKSKHSKRAIVRGKSCHSALTSEGVNAVEAAAELIMIIKRRAAEFAAGGARDAEHVVPHTTGLTTIVHGGIANNIVPDRCDVEFEFRGIAADDPRAICDAVAAEARATIESWMQARDPSTGIDFLEVLDYPALETPRDAEIVQLGCNLSRTNQTSKVSFGTEAGLFDAMAGIPSIVIGPGDIAQAHKPDEWIAEDQLLAAARFVHRLIDHCRH